MMSRRRLPEDSPLAGQDIRMLLDELSSATQPPQQSSAPGLAQGGMLSILLNSLRKPKPRVETSYEVNNAT